MASIDEIRNIRIEKLNALKAKGISPYPISSKRTHTILDTVNDFSKIAQSKKTVTLAGRVMSLRPQGAIIFLTLDDGTAKFQGLLKIGDIPDASFELFANTVDIGDIIEITGSLILSKREEKTLAATDWSILAKSLRPLPEKWHGLQGVEERFRKRYLDVLMSPEVKERFIARTKIISEIRAFLDKEDFLEVETPILQTLAGGASAEPFKTHYNALGADFYLRIAPELYLKKLLIAGFPKVYEIGRNFRNEGIDVVHHPEFTMLEYYESFSDSIKQRAFVEKIIKATVKKVTGKLSVTFDGQEIDFSKKFAVISYADLLKRFALLSNPESISLEEVRLKASQLGVTYKPEDPVEKIIDSIYKKTCRPKLIQPTFIIDYPTAFFPLAKKSEKKDGCIDAFQLLIGGLETVKAFSELNDPLDQRERFMSQEKNKESGDKEAQPNDEEYLEAMEFGMPPAGGVGIGIDRLVMLLTNTKNIREVILFPTLRPKKD